MKKVIITRASQPLKHNLQQEIARLLALAFAQDNAMLAMLGQARWAEIREAYFLFQLHHPDCILLAHQGNTLLGALIATTPDARFSFTTAMRQLFTMKRLLRQHYRQSQGIASQIVQHVPDTPHAYINQIAVRPAQQRKAIGQQLLSELGTITDGLPVYVDCEASLAPFYSRAGFTQCAEVAAHDLIVMTRPETSARML